MRYLSGIVSGLARGSGLAEPKNNRFSIFIPIEIETFERPERPMKIDLKYINTGHEQNETSDYNLPSLF